MAERSRTPWALTEATVGAGELVAAEVVLARGSKHPRAAAIRLEERSIRVLWADGAIQVVPNFGEVRR